MTSANTLALGTLIAIATAIPASAQQYKARSIPDAVQLEDTKTHTVVTIVPSVGNQAMEMTVNGTNVFRANYASAADLRARPGMAGIPFLAPWANRLDEQAFWANGKRYALDMDLGNVRGAIPNHGFLTTNDKWQVVEAKADGKSAWVTSRLEFYKQPMWMKQWPFAHTIDMTYRLQEGVLQIETKITNMSAEPMPVSIGFHPYFQLKDSPRNEWTISVPVKTRYVLSKTKAPDGETEPIEKFFPHPASIALKDYNLDDVFDDMTRDAQGRAHFIVKGKQQQLDVIFGQNFKGVSIYSPNSLNTGMGSQLIAQQAGVRAGAPLNANPNAPANAAAPASANSPARANAPANADAPAGRAGGPGGAAGATPDELGFVCFEPHAALSNAMNMAQAGVYRQLQYVQPGATWVESFWVKPSGF